jgi:hypothetical protein
MKNHNACRESLLGLSSSVWWIKGSIRTAPKKNFSDGQLHL